MVHKQIWKTDIMKLLSKLIMLLFLVWVTANSCKQDDDGEIETIKVVDRGIYELMKDVYLWYDQLPEINPDSYSSPDALMDALRYGTYDKWSTVLTKTEYNQYFEAGQMIGHGFMLGEDAGGKIRIAFVYRNTQAHDLGVRRGWIITHVNGTVATTGNVFDLLGPSEEGHSNTITFINGDTVTISLNLTKEVIDITPVVHYEVLQSGESRIGYMVFQDFIDAARTELDEAFDLFRSQGVNELIIDLRYNGGGSVDVAEYLAGWLLGKNHAGQPFVNFRHNNKLVSWDTTLNIPGNANGLELGRVFFVGTGSTASASELIINGMKPYLSSVTMAGSTTHGKPVGMYAFPFTNYDYVVLPITFKYTNANEVGDFYNGISADLQAADDLTHDFGDPDENILKTVLNYIADGSALTIKSALVTGKPLGKNKGLREYLKAY